jgi:hypothetical protein
MGDGVNWWAWQPRPSVAQRRKTAARLVATLRRKGQAVSPVRIEGRAIVRTFWGQAWCDNLLSYSDYANRLPRGQSYVRNGCVVDLRIEPGSVAALVSGSEIYTVGIEIRPLARTAWARLVKRCAGRIESAVELLRGELSGAVMEIIARRDGGLFPPPRAMTMRCSCPDWAVMCKHVAAVLYGVGARLDERPELLFVLRGVDHLELISAAPGGVGPGRKRGAGGGSKVKGARLGEIFGIELEAPGRAASAHARKRGK